MNRQPCFCLTILTQPSKSPYPTGYKISREVWIHDMFFFAEAVAASVAYCSLCFFAQVLGCSVPVFQQRSGVRMNAPECRAHRPALHCWAGRSGWRGWIPAVQTPSTGGRAYKGSVCTSLQNKPTWERRNGLDSADAGRFPSASAALWMSLSPSWSTVVVGHSIAKDAAHQILSRGALVRIQQVLFQEF